MAIDDVTITLSRTDAELLARFIERMKAGLKHLSREELSYTYWDGVTALDLELKDAGVDPAPLRQIVFMS